MFYKIKRKASLLKNTLVSPSISETKRHNELLAMEHLRPLYANYLPWTSSSLSPSSIEVILNDIVVHQRKNIIEFGSGISTIFIAKILKDRGGHLFSVEHDLDWMKVVSSELDKESLSQQVTLVHAPLVNSPWGELQQTMQNERFNYCWYDTERLNVSLPQSEIDLVLVDGPPAYQQQCRHARYPALPYLINRLANSHTVILDDANRAGEQTVLMHWKQEFNKHFNILKTRGDIAISQQNTLYTV